MTTLTEEQALALCEKYADCTAMAGIVILGTYSGYEMATALRRSATDASALASAYKALLDEKAALTEQVASWHRIATAEARARNEEREANNVLRDENAALELMVDSLTPAAEPFRTGPSEETAWLIEAPGINYLAARKLGGYEFYWTKDHLAALRFHSREQADLTMMAIRQMNPALFSFAVHLGDASPVEHAWVSEGRPTTKPGEA